MAQKPADTAVPLRERVIDLEHTAITLRKNLDEAHEKIDSLKSIARFYRAQRDRVDAYLSGVLDEHDRDSQRQNGLFGTPAETRRDLERAVTNAHEVLQSSANRGDRRPDIREPFVKFPEDDGRGFTRYRDAEPDPGWEDY